MKISIETHEKICDVLMWVNVIGMSMFVGWLIGSAT